MLKAENIVVTNGATHHFKLKQGSKIVFFNSNTLTEFTKVPCTVREKNVPVFIKFVVSRLQFRQFFFDLKENVTILKPGFWATK